MGQILVCGTNSGVNMSEDKGIVEIKDETGSTAGFRCSVCGRFFGLYEQAQALKCLENHRNLLTEDM